MAGGFQYMRVTLDLHSDPAYEYHQRTYILGCRDGKTNPMEWPSSGHGVLDLSTCAQHRISTQASLPSTYHDDKLPGLNKRQ